MSDLARLPWRLRYKYAAMLGFKWRRLMVLATHRHADIAIDRSARLGPRFALFAPGPARIRIGPGCEFRRDFYLEVHGDGFVELDANVVFTGAAAVQISTSLRIGARAALGVGTFIADGNHTYNDPDTHFMESEYDLQPITIGEGAAIMTGSTIMAPVGKRAAIGANSVVTEPIPDYCLAVGSPARVVEYFGPPESAPDLPQHLDRRKRIPD